MATPARTSKRTFSSFTGHLKNQKWLTLICLPVLLFAALNNIYWPWGAMFVYWGVTSMRSGEVFLLEPINLNEDPALFWIISIMWIGSGCLYMLADFFPELLF